MFLLPLGPKGKLPDVPLMTIVVGVCTIAFSIFTFRSGDQVITRTMKHEGYRASLSASEEVAKKWCETESLSTADCLRLKQESTAFHLLSKKEMVSSLTSFVEPVKGIQTKTFFESANEAKLISYADEVFKRLEAMPEYNAWKSHVSDTYKKGYWLTNKTVSFLSVMKAQFTHGGWIHLIMNMIFFFAFAGALEMRVGIFAWLAVYFIGGATGLTLYATTALPNGVPLLGASAGISALAGAYLVFFWKHPTRVLLAFIIYNKVVLIPTFAFVLVMLVSQDLAGSMEATGRTAYLAHLGGLIFGIVCAVIHKSFVTGDFPFLYPHEQDAFDEAQDSPEALALYDQILVWNPENVIARDLAFNEVMKPTVPTKARISFLKFHLQETVTQLRRDKDIDRILSLARRLMETPELKESLQMLTAPQVTFVVRLLIDNTAEDVAEVWIKVAPEALPQLKRSNEFRILAQPFIKKPKEVMSA